MTGGELIVSIKVIAVLNFCAELSGGECEGLDSEKGLEARGEKSLSFSVLLSNVNFMINIIYV